MKQSTGLIIGIGAVVAVGAGILAAVVLGRKPAVPPPTTQAPVIITQPAPTPPPVVQAPPAPKKPDWLSALEIGAGIGSTILSKM